ncbi:MAG TPA: hypothetical protein VIJ95_17395 [Hanamia sp.]
MRLLAKYNRLNIPITIAALLISSIGFYHPLCAGATSWIKNCV